MDALKTNRLAVAALGLLLLAGCGVGRKMALSTMVPLVQTTVEAVYRDQDVETVGKGLPANMLLVRGMCESDPGNRDLWMLGTQIYFYYGMGFVEDEDPDNALLVYRQGFDLGSRFLARAGWLDTGRELDAYKAGLRKAKREDVPILFWSLANWVSWINLNLNKPAAVAELPYAEAALARILELDPAYFNGMPHVLLGTLMASKPVLMGGDPETARAEFERAFVLSGRRLLIFQVLYARSVCRQILDEECFRGSLAEVLEAPADLAPEYRLLNEVAKRKASRLMERMDDWF